MKTPEEVPAFCGVLRNVGGAYDKLFREAADTLAAYEAREAQVRAEVMALGKTEHFNIALRIGAILGMVVVAEAAISEHEFVGDEADCKVCNEGRLHYLHTEQSDDIAEQQRWHQP